ncbi:MAG: two-component sensor histidine kinase [Candidatus Nephthysia bennettiae]|uniref:histidine kinase n=1 Tax=Candidatus Nephthysia bennettiae TaxID=3127016 RepID=A0A934KD26_9BACT|nr:HAMP domain-containing histidine kinase [Candidatus Dormibacteraeota bacterium]MBJ7610719.1 HAMP domain-containing histidine kinase [Candidatus Dormibacteraeota bacterium]PZR92747.1 MAG: two-component sensor histidine kinase [Candidatus Dormibacteraeota bacterium]
MTRSLRGRLLLGLIALVVGGLLVADVATYSALQQFLIGRVDKQLYDARYSAPEYVVQELEHGGQGRPGPPGSALPTGIYVEIRAPDGSSVRQAFPGFGESASARPVLPAQLDAGPDASSPPFTVAGTGGVSQYRVLAETSTRGPTTSDTVILAIPLSDVQSTLDLLLLLEASVGVVVLLALAIFAWFIIGVGLRPLEQMGATAKAIAAGDLSRRVEPATPRTEIGRLGLALNGMLSQIESAFAERTRSEQRLRRFVADASHELRTPLTSIRGYAELLRRGAAQPPRDAALARRRIEEEAIRMSVLVDDLLLLARLDQGRPLEQAPVDLEKIARDACSDAGAVARQRQITLDASGPVLINGDDVRMRQVVANLVSNAIVHTPPESPIDVRVSSGSGRAILTVADHGRGLTDEEAARAFEPFYRADPGRSRDRGGAGLGLSIVAAVVAAHDGAVEVLKTVGGGATFRVELPLLSSSASQPDPAAA